MTLGIVVLVVLMGINFATSGPINDPPNGWEQPTTEEIEKKAE